MFLRAVDAQGFVALNDLMPGGTFTRLELEEGVTRNPIAARKDSQSTVTLAVSFGVMREHLAPIRHSRSKP